MNADRVKPAPGQNESKPRPIRLIFDARYIRVDFHDGISRFSSELAAAVHEAAAESGVDVAYLIFDERQRSFLPAGARVQMFHAPTSAAEPFAALKLNKFRADVVFSPMQTIGSLGRRFKLILTLHDTIYYRHRTPPKNLPELVRIGWRIFHLSYMPQRFVLNGADVVATVSETSKREFARVRLTKRPVIVLGNAPQQLEALLPAQQAESQIAADRSRLEQTDSEQTNSEQADSALIRSAQPPRNIVYMGSFMPYKNVETMVQAMNQLPEYTLHLLSRVSAEQQAGFVAMAPDAQIVFYNGVSDEQYAQLLNDRALLATLSLDEGYGLPLAEAQAFGVPMVVSDLEIFHEVAGVGALFVPPTDAAAFAQAVRQLDDDGVRAKIVAAGLLQSQRYSWQHTSETLLNSVGGLAGS